MSIDSTSILYGIGDSVKQITNGHELRIANVESQITALGGQAPPPSGLFTVNNVTWTNLSEINLSGEKIINPDFDLDNIAVGDIREVTTSWTNSAKTAQVGELAKVLHISGDGSVQFEITRTTPQTVEVITEFTNELIGREFRAIITNSNEARNYTAGEVYSITSIPSSHQAEHSGGGNILFAQQGEHWELLTEVTTEVIKIWIGGANTKSNTRRADLYGWEVTAGELEPVELESGLVKGTTGRVIITQRFSEGLTTGNYQVQVVRPTGQTSGKINLTTLNYATAGNQPQSQTVTWTKNGIESTSSILEVEPGDEVSFDPNIAPVFGLKVSTNHGERIIDSVSLFKGEISGGTVEASGNSIQKISGDSGFNAGASSSQSIPAGENGYYQFQYAGGNVRIGVVYEDTTYSETNEPEKFQVQIRPGNKSITGDGYNSGNDFLEVGDFFRIRHYGASNEIKFQRKEAIYGEDTDYVFPTTPTSGENHVFDTTDRPLVQAIKDSNNGLVAGELYRMHTINVNQTSGQYEVAKLHEIDGTFIGWFDRSFWQVAKEIGQDYVTFFTPTLLTLNDNLFLDVSFSQISSQINDALIATQNN